MCAYPVGDTHPSLDRAQAARKGAENYSNMRTKIVPELQKMQLYTPRHSALPQKPPADEAHTCDTILLAPKGLLCNTKTATGPCAVHICACKI